MQLKTSFKIKKYRKIIATKKRELIIKNKEKNFKKMSIRLSSNTRVNQETDKEEDEESLVELGQIAILSSSKATLKYSSLSNGLNDDLTNSKLIYSKKEQENNEQVVHVEYSTDSTEQTRQDSLLDKIKLHVYLPFRGYFYGLLSAFCFCLSQILQKRSLFLSGSDHSTIRYLTTFIVMVTFIKYKNLSLMGPKKQFNLILFRGLFGKFIVKNLTTLRFKLIFIFSSNSILKQF